MLSLQDIVYNLLYFSMYLMGYVNLVGIMATIILVPYF